MGKYKTTNALMKHLRENHNIAINGSKQKQLLITDGYFHGYKGYRFYKNPDRPITFENYDQVHAIIAFDSELKSILYPHVMFLETALKSVVTQTIIDYIEDDRIETMLDKAIVGYNKMPAFYTNNQRQKCQKKYLEIKNLISKKIFSQYQKDSKINHYFNGVSSKNDVPVYAIIETFMMGEFGKLVGSLNKDVINRINLQFNIENKLDANRDIFAFLIYILKDLMNAIAHNQIIYDARCLTFKPQNNVLIYIENNSGLPKISFKSIIDYIGVIVCFEKHLFVGKKTINKLLDDIERAFDKYVDGVGESIAFKYMPNTYHKMLELIHGKQ